MPRTVGAVVDSLLLRARPDPAWLPRGSRADVMLGEPPDDEPTGLVRLLVVRRAEIFCLPRTEDGRLDLPTRRVSAGEHPRRAVEALAALVLGAGTAVRPSGYVRNLVPSPASDYPWPAPVACFSVWRSSGIPVVDGVWCSRTELGERHWWPLAEHEAGQRQRACGDHPSVPDR